MSQSFREGQLEHMKTGERWGIFATIAFGMVRVLLYKAKIITHQKQRQGMDLTGIDLVVQWKAPSDLSTLWQRFGRVARGPGETAFAVLIVQRADLVETAILKTKKAEKKQAKATTKRRATLTIEQPPPKRQTLASCNPNTLQVASPVTISPVGQLPASNLSDTEDEFDDSNSSENETDSDSNADADGEDDPDYTQAVGGGGGAFAEVVPEVRPSVISTAVLAERRAHYKKDVAQGESSKAVARKTGDAVEGTAMYNFINAEAFGCRRVVPALYFRNDKDRECSLSVGSHQVHTTRTAGNDHLECDQITIGGCPHCKPQSATICCDYCHPNSFKKFQNSTEKMSRPTGTCKSKLKLSIAPPDNTSELRGLLLAWRDKATLEAYGESMTTYCGSQLLMSDRIVQRLIDCAAAHKIKTHQDITRETGWAVERAQLHGERIILCLISVFPLPVQPPKPPGPAKRRPPATQKCSQCGSTQHISMFIYHIPLFYFQ